MLNAFATGPKVPATMGKTDATNHHLLRICVRRGKFKDTDGNSRWIKLLVPDGLRRFMAILPSDVAIDFLEIIGARTW